MNNIQLERKTFEKLIKPLQGVDLFDEYIKIRLKISSLSANKRKAVMTHILYQYHTDSAVEEFIDKLDQMILQEISETTKVLKI